jgi:glycosyltransferase involved in cell wall biosynthesis
VHGTSAASAAGSSAVAHHPPTHAAPILLLVARLRWEKGLGAFAAVVARLAERGVAFRVAVVGDGPAREAFRAKLPPSATFFGTLTGAALAEAYSSSDVFLFPSTTEGWGATCLEAQAAGLPVVATASSGIVDVVAHGVGGFLLPPHNASALADAVGTLVADAALRRRMGRAAVHHAAAFDWARSGDRMLCEYARHAGAGSAPERGRDGDDARPPPALSERLATAAGYPPYHPCPQSDVF